MFLSLSMVEWVNAFEMIVITKIGVRVDKSKLSFGFLELTGFAADNGAYL
jgi:hypothetical protein